MPGILNAAYGMKGPTSAAIGLVVCYGMKSASQLACNLVAAGEAAAHLTT